MNKKNIPLYVALAVPALMILLVAGFIYFPGLGKHPQYNFLYLTGANIYDYGYNGGGYSVSGNKLVYNQPTVPDKFNKVYSDQVNFYVYNVSSNQSTAISLEQAKTLNLDPSLTSPDGYTVTQGNGGGDFLFGGGGDYNSWFLKGHNRSTKLNLKLSGPYSYGNFRFLGWINN